MKRLLLVALSAPATVSARALSLIKSADALFVQTEESPAMLPLKNMRLRYESMDELYNEAEDFDELSERIAIRLIDACEEGKTVAYVVPGSGISQFSAMLFQRANAAGIAFFAHYGAPFSVAAMASANVFQGAYSIVAATELTKDLNTNTLLAIEEIDTPLRMGEVKLLLSEYYPDAHNVYLCHMQKNGEYEAQAMPLYETDRQTHFHAATVLLVPPVAPLELERFGYSSLVDIMHKLRARDGCPWDAEQTHESLKKNMIEECYEALDAIDKKDDAALCEELGDVLLQCVFHAEIAKSEGRFSERDVTTGIVKKLIYRHPHIFSNAMLSTADDVKLRWEELKKVEKDIKTHSEALFAVPKNFPALMRAQKLQKKAAQAGFDWEHASDAFLKLEEEVRELKEAMACDTNIAEEMGDVFFAAVNVARLLKLDSEGLLQAASEKFVQRFSKMEALALFEGRKLEELSLQEQDRLWEAIKTLENGQK